MIAIIASPCTPEQNLFEPQEDLDYWVYGEEEQQDATPLLVEDSFEIDEYQSTEII